MIPEKTSSAYKLYKNRAAYINELDFLIGELEAFCDAITRNEFISTSRVREVVGASINLSIESPISEDLVGLVNEEINQYLDDRKFHSEILPFTIPVIVSLAFILIGIASWIRLYV